MAAGDQHYLEIGRMAHKFANLEHYVATTIWASLGDINDQRFRAVTADLGWAAKLNVLAALLPIVETRDGSQRATEREARWSEFFAEAREIARDRNRLLHSPLMSEAPAEFTDEVHAFGISRSNRNRGGFEWHPYTVESIRAVSERIGAAHRRLINLTISSNSELRQEDD